MLQVQRDGDDFALVCKYSTPVADAKILTKIFVLCDETGDEVVDAQKFMAAASVLVAAEADAKFATAFSFYDFASSGKISIDDAVAAVSGACVQCLPCTFQTKRQSCCALSWYWCWSMMW